MSFVKFSQISPPWSPWNLEVSHSPLLCSPKLVNIKKKEERVLDIREEKAHRIAALETSIEKELLKRLREVCQSLKPPARNG